MFSNEWTTNQTVDGIKFATVTHAFYYFTTLAFEEENSLNNKVSSYFLKESDGSQLAGIKIKNALTVQSRKFNKKSWDAFCEKWLACESFEKKKYGKGWAVMRKCLVSKFKDEQLKKLLIQSKENDVYLSCNTRFTPKHATDSSIFQYTLGEFLTSMDQLLQSDDFGTLYYAKVEDLYLVGHNMVGRLLMDIREKL